VVTDSETRVTHHFTDQNWLFAFYSLHIMSTAYDQIVDCANNILEVMGTCGYASVQLSTSGRLPQFPVVTIADLVPPSAYERLDPSVRSRVSDVVDRRLASLRLQSRKHYLNLAETLLSAENFGMRDVDVESQIIDMFELSYRRSHDDLRCSLTRLLARSSNTLEYRNTRGGFGDVSPPFYNSS